MMLRTLKPKLGSFPHMRISLLLRSHIISHENAQQEKHTRREFRARHYDRNNSRVSHTHHSLATVASHFHPDPNATHVAPVHVPNGVLCVTDVLKLDEGKTCRENHHTDHLAGRERERENIPGGFLATQTLFSGPYLSNSLSSSGFEPPDPRSPMYTRATSPPRDMIAF